jgi:hypothetical protein
VRRITAREFRATFPRLTEPVLVGQGVWFPDVSMVKAVAPEAKGKASERVHAEPEVYTGDPVEMTRRDVLRQQSERDAILRKLRTGKGRT